MPFYEHYTSFTAISTITNFSNAKDNLEEMTKCPSQKHSHIFALKH